MRLLRVSLVLFAILSIAGLAKADTIKFTATVTSQGGLNAIPIGATYTGYATYNGSFAYNSPLAPPPLTSYAFTYPSAPLAITDLKWDFIERPPAQTTLALGLMFVDFSSPFASFSINNGIFTIFTPTNETANSVGWTNAETGTVTYTYLFDPTTTPEPTSIALVGSGILAFIAVRRGKYGRMSYPR